MHTAFFISSAFIGHEAHELLLKSALENTWETPALKTLLCVFEVLLPAWAHIFSLVFAFQRGLQRNKTQQAKPAIAVDPLITEAEVSFTDEGQSFLMGNLDG